MSKLKISRANIIILLLLVILSVPAIYSLFHSGFFVTDDGEWMVIRFSAFYQALRDGQFPVRFLERLNNGFGYPVANFLYPGFMYLGIPIHILGFDFVNTIKVIFGLSMIGSAVFTYLWLSKIFNKSSAFIGALFYLYTPYHLFDLYKRGSIGEVLALAVIPFILWQIERKSLFFSSLGIAFLILSHNTLALLFLPLITVYAIIVRANDSESRTRKFTYRNFLSLIFGIGISSFFWIPAIFELQYTRFSQTQVSDFRNYFADIGLIGVSTVVVLALSMFFFYKVQPWKRLNLHVNLHEKLFVFFLIIGVVSALFSLDISKSLWNFLPSSFIQFPFRLLSYLILSVSFLSAYIIYQLKGNLRYFVSIFFISILAFSAFSYIKPSEFFDKPEGFYATNEGTTTVQDEYLPKWIKQKPAEHFKEKVEIISGKGSIENLVYNSKKMSFSTQLSVDSKVIINTIYYPGWKAYVDGNQSNIKYNNNQGIMELSAPNGNHIIKLSFSETPLRLFADITSILSFIILVFYLYKKNYQ